MADAGTPSGIAQQSPCLAGVCSESCFGHAHDVEVERFDECSGGADVGKVCAGEKVRDSDFSRVEVGVVGLGCG